MSVNLSIIAAAFGGFTLGWNLRGGNLGAQRLTWNEGRTMPRFCSSGDPGLLRPTMPTHEITTACQQPVRRVYHYNPATIAECGGPCEEGGPGACDCGAVTWNDQPVKPEFPPPRKIRDDWS